MARRSLFLKACSYPGGCPALTRERFCPRHQHAYSRIRAIANAFYKSPEWRALRALFLAAHPSCYFCGLRATEVDHIIPRSQGGSDAPSNLMALCKSCHARKGSTNGERWGRTAVMV